MMILVGLGNPGAQYARHRHNIGFMMLDEIHRHYGFAPWRDKNNSARSEGHIGKNKIVLVKPMAYMNKSGLPIKDVVGFYKITPEQRCTQLIVAHDDIDLAAGKLRVKTGGGHGGHNGLRDIDRHLGADYRRLRIGVGRPDFADSDQEVDRHVLSDFTQDEFKSWVKPLIACMAEKIDLLFDDGGDNFMTNVARLCPPPLKSSDETKQD